ncbi:hypothetical protein [Oceanithermus sp.]|uniref:hypothetical protein n=1 Tax=Oceanithermus sp. TaxID=2268145 RepID=UPI00257F096E|nr:hypothetical protein [Oceanithermus sp.]
MSWKLDVYTPDGSSLRASYTDTAPGGIVGGFQWTARGDGAPLRMTWSAVPKSVDIQPRDIVQLTVDGKAAFWGPVVRTWPADESGVREYVALGGIELLRYRSHVDPASYSEQDIAAIARDVISAYKHPAITYDAALIPDLGDTLAMPVVYRLELGEILDTLARSSSKTVTWGVDAQGRAYFAEAASTLNVAYESSDLHWQPEEADDIVTRVDLVLATRGEPQPDGIKFAPNFWGTPECPGFPKVPSPIVVSNYATEDATYGVHRTIAAPNFLVQKSSPAPILFLTNNIQNPSNAYDGINSSYANNQFAGDAELGVELQGYARGVAIGYAIFNNDLEMEVEFEYSWTADTVPPGSLTCSYAMTYLYRFQPTEDGTVRIVALPPLDPNRTSELNLTTKVTLRVRGTTAADEWRIHEIQTIGIDYIAAIEYINSLIKVPTRRPAQVRWDRYQEPAAQVTITGAPGGDLTHRVEEWRYSWTPDRLETVARLGSRADDEMTRAIDRIVRLGNSSALRTARTLTEVK